MTVVDTFRWKGENVSTPEVNAAVVDCPGVTEATTYGVEIPGSDGRAGMAAIVIDNHFDIGEFASRLAQRLPMYACPVMIRICTALDSTETFKQKKHELVRDGFDPHQVTYLFRCFFANPKSGEYRPIDETCLRAHRRWLDPALSRYRFPPSRKAYRKWRASVYQRR